MHHTFTKVLVSCLVAFACPVLAENSLRIGFSPNVLHAQALHGRCTKSFEKSLGIPIQWIEVRPGRIALEGMLAGQIDAAYVSPGAVLETLRKNGNKGFVIIAGATSGGAGLVLSGRSPIDSDDDFSQKIIATAQPGSGPDMTARKWFTSHGFSPKKPKTGVRMVTLPYLDMLSQFERKTIDGAWVSEPWLSRLEEKGGNLYIDERDLWPSKQFATTSLAVASSYLLRAPTVIDKLLNAHIGATKDINSDKRRALGDINACLKAERRSPASEEMPAASLERIELTWDPLIPTYRSLASEPLPEGSQRGKKPNIDALFQMTRLNVSLTKLGLEKVSN